jgi:predicted glutamine amidotransferase
VQQTNCHPFRHDRWLFMHNGYINEFATIKRDLILAVDASVYGIVGPDHAEMRPFQPKAPSTSVPIRA